MQEAADQPLSTGILSLDGIIEHVRLGDNIVWLVSSREQYDYFAARFVGHCVDESMELFYVHFDDRIDYSTLGAARHMNVVDIDPLADRQVALDILQECVPVQPAATHYLFDNLSVLAESWGDDELVEFFQHVCPRLFELDAVAYFCLVKGEQSNRAVAKIRDTTQILLDVYEDAGRVLLKPIKVWDRYSERMFQPHMLSGGQFVPVDSLAGQDAVHAPAGEADLLAKFEEPAVRTSSPSIREELIRSIISKRPEYIHIAADYFSVEHLMNVRSRLVGSGLIGGKAAGMLLSDRILRSACAEDGCEERLEHLTTPESYFVGSGVFFNFLINNNLLHWLDLKHEEPSEVRERFPELQKDFQAGEFPQAIRRELRQVVRALGDGPIIVRSSSLLEDSFNMAFAGKYDSFFLGNQGHLEDRLDALVSGIKRVYASMLSPDAVTYRQRRNLLEFQEHMAVLIQKVRGQPYKGLHFPVAAGVAFSRNPYPWSERIDASAGLVRLVFGLGTRAVDRVEGDYPRLIALSHPGLHPDGDYLNSRRYHQKYMDAIGLEGGDLRTVSIHDEIDSDFPRAFYVFSIFKDGFIKPPVSRRLRAEPYELTVTFQMLLERTNFVDLVRYVLSTVEDRYRFPVDLEFTLDIDDEGEVEFCLLQCRPLTQRTEFQPAELPEDLPEDRVLFTTRKAVSNGELHDVRYIALIDSRGYDAIPTNQMRSRLARAVGALNHLPQMQEAGYILIGPGRWGSENIELGVPVTYSEINNARLLIEMARQKDGYTPEVSYGTHFFQDLMESEIFYLPLYPENAATTYNEEFFSRADNALPELAPDYADMAEYLKVIDVPACADGLRAHVAMNREESLAMAYLGPAEDID